MDFTSQERIRANVCFERLSQGWDPEAAYELIILFKGKSDTYWDKRKIRFPKEKKRDSITGHTEEIGNITISENNAGSTDKEEEKVERIGNYKVEFMTVKNETIGVMRFWHFWGSDTGTMGLKHPPSYFVMYINFTELSCIKFLRGDYKQAPLPWRYSWRYWFSRFFEGYEMVFYEPRMITLYQDKNIPDILSSRFGYSKYRIKRWSYYVQYWFYYGLERVAAMPFIARIILALIYFIIIFKLIVWIGMWLFMIHPIIPVGLNGLILIGEIGELKSSKDKKEIVFAMLFLSGTMIVFLIEFYHYYFG